MSRLGTKSSMIDYGRLYIARVDDIDDAEEVLKMFPIGSFSNHDVYELGRLLFPSLENETEKAILHEMLSRLSEDRQHVRKPIAIKHKFAIGEVVELRGERRIKQDFFDKTEDWSPVKITGYAESDRFPCYKVQCLVSGSNFVSHYHEHDLRIAVNPCID